MRLSKRVAGVIVGASLVAGTIGGGVVFAQAPQPATPPAVQQSTTSQPATPAVQNTSGQQDQAQNKADQQDQAQDPSYKGSITINENQSTGQNEQDESAALQSLAKISADQAKAAALAANAGATVKSVTLQGENGSLVYGVELANGMDVKVDAGNGQVLHTEQNDQESGANEKGAGHEAESGQAGGTEAPEAAGATAQ